MSSAERCRAVVVLSRISRIFNRGSVTFRPALRRSLLSTGGLQRQPRSKRRAAAVRDQVLLCRTDTLNSMSHCTHTRPERKNSPVNRSILRGLALGLVAVGTLLSGCVYRMNIQQGNYLEGRTVDQLQVGMTRNQVRYLLGTPMVPDAFD